MQPLLALQPSSFACPAVWPWSMTTELTRLRYFLFPGGTGDVPDEHAGQLIKTEILQLLHDTMAKLAHVHADKD